MSSLYAFNTIDDLKKHGKRTHPNYVKICEKFLAGTCVRNSDSCWYKHEAEHAVRHEEDENAPPNQNAHGKPNHKSSKTKRFLERESQQHQTSYQAQPVPWQWMDQQTAQLLGRY